ncbi:MAG: fatty-acyl-CoA synthase, partial [Actinomycetota bacterium]|nr:fatty-acyl-CoA synthase [Actinomycetota bacterium]
MVALPSYASGASTSPLLGDTIGENLRSTARRVPDSEALVECATGRRWTYAELDAEVDRLAKALLAYGLNKGDRVGIWAPNVAEWVVVQYATARVGVVLTNVNPAYRSHELSYVIQQSGMRLLISALRHKTSDY